RHCDDDQPRTDLRKCFHPPSPLKVSTPRGSSGRQSILYFCESDAARRRQSSDRGVHFYRLSAITSSDDADLGAVGVKRRSSRFLILPNNNEPWTAVTAGLRRSTGGQLKAEGAASAAAISTAICAALLEWQSNRDG